MSPTKKSGFSFVELMITIILMAMTLAPVMALFSVALEDVSMTSEISTAIHLGQEGMEMIRNMKISVVRDLPSDYYPDLKEEALFINHHYWRIKRIIHSDTYPLRVDIQVIQEPYDRVFLTLSTLLEDLF